MTELNTTEALKSVTISEFVMVDCEKNGIAICSASGCELMAFTPDGAVKLQAWLEAREMAEKPLPCAEIDGITVEDSAPEVIVLHARASSVTIAGTDPGYVLVKLSDDAIEKFHDWLSDSNRERCEHNACAQADPAEVNRNAALRIFTDTEALSALVAHAYGMAMGNLNPEDVADYMAIASAAAHLVARQRVFEIQKSQVESLPPRTATLRTLNDALALVNSELGMKEGADLGEAVKQLIDESYEAHARIVFERGGNLPPGLDQRVILDHPGCDKTKFGVYPSGVKIGDANYNVSLYATPSTTGTSDLRTRIAMAVREYVEDLAQLAERKQADCATRPLINLNIAPENVTFFIYGFSLRKMEPVAASHD